MRPLRVLFACTALALTVGSAACAAPEEEAGEAGNAMSAGIESTTEGGFDLQNAAWLARVARGSYLGHQDQKDFLAALAKREKIKFTGFKYFETNDDTQAAYFATKDFAVLVFPGTASGRDALTDLKALYRLSDAALLADPENPEVQLHRGFYRSLKGIWFDEGGAIVSASAEAKVRGIKAFLETQHDKKLPLYVTGHSLGGALATLAVRELFKMNIPVTASYTFGAPRSGNAKYAGELHAVAAKRGTRIFRVANFGDAVTVVPPMWAGYQHVGPAGASEDDGNEHFVFLDKDGTLRRSATNGHHTTWARLESYWGVIQTGELQAHPMAYYSCKLDKALDPTAVCEPDFAEPYKHCADVAHAYANVEQRSTMSGGCGDTEEQVAYQAWIQALRCSRVEGVKDQGRLTECLPKLEKIACSALRSKSGPQIPESCRDLFVYKKDATPPKDRN